MTLTRFTGLAVPLVLLIGILALIVTAGRRAADPTFWVTAADGASGGGVRDQVLGTLLLVASTAAIALPTGLGLGLLLSEYAPARLRRKAHTLTVVVGGTPSILLGLAGYAVFSTALGWGKSWLAGTLVLSVLVIPVVVVATVSRLACLPPQQRETAAALGLTRNQVCGSVLIPYARPAVLTGLLLGLARVTGETAPLLFTATVFSGVSSLPRGVADSPVVALPTHVFALAQDAADPEAMATAWGSALVLVVVTAVLLLAALPIRRKLEMKP
jgi:phosphate transport system permease protein